MYDHNYVIRLLAERDALRTEVDRLTRLINSPGTGDFLEAVRTEAAHQVERWQDDRAKDDLDWLWLIAYLSGKVRFGKTDPSFGASRAELFADAALSHADRLTGIPAKYADGGHEKYLHRIVTVAAAALNWHRNRRA